MSTRSKGGSSKDTREGRCEQAHSALVLRAMVAQRPGAACPGAACLVLDLVLLDLVLLDLSSISLLLHTTATQLPVLQLTPLAVQ